MHSLLTYLGIGVAVVLLVAFRLVIAGPFGAYPAKYGFLPKSWRRWILDEPHQTR